MTSIAWTIGGGKPGGSAVVPASTTTTSRASIIANAAAHSHQASRAAVRPLTRPPRWVPSGKPPTDSSRRDRAWHCPLRRLLQRQPLSALRRSASTATQGASPTTVPRPLGTGSPRQSPRGRVQQAGLRRAGSRSGAGTFGQACARVGFRLLRSTPMATTQKTSMTVSPAASATAGPCPSTSDQALPEAWSNTVNRMLAPDPL